VHDGRVPRVSHRPPALLGFILGAVVALCGLYLLAANVVGDWKVAAERCSSTPPGDGDGDNPLAGSEVRSSSSWLPYWECSRNYKDGTVRQRSIHVGWP
jgi:hypothetical protein